MQTLRFASANVAARYPLEISGAAAWRQSEGGWSSTIALGDLPNDHIVVPSFAMAGLARTDFRRRTDRIGRCMAHRSDSARRARRYQPGPTRNHAHRLFPLSGRDCGDVAHGFGSHRARAGQLPDVRLDASIPDRRGSRRRGYAAPGRAADQSADGPKGASLSHLLTDERRDGARLPRHRRLVGQPSCASVYTSRRVSSACGRWRFEPRRMQA